MLDARQQTYEQVEEDFENTRDEIAGLVAELSDAAFANPQIDDALYGEIVSHYQQHAPPGDPQFPSARYCGTHSGIGYALHQYKSNFITVHRCNQGIDVPCISVGLSAR